jgi:MoaA/NifB/PqqE/SkfB family radical SAM enzyme
MKIYTILKINKFIKNFRFKFLLLFLAHKFNKRYLAVNFDPVNACNLRCKMCYFTDSDYVKKLKGVFDKKDLNRLGEVILKRALKFQVGCGTEPTLYKHLDDVFKIAKIYKVPHISLTTNANLIEKAKLKLWVESGLNEIIISLHGVHKDTYEFFMQKGSYETFLKSLQIITEIKKEYKNFSLRINYTFNEDNFKELAEFMTVFGGFDIDTLQIRPINNLGNTAYQNFEMDSIIPFYDSLLNNLKQVCKQKKITLIAPSSSKKLLHKKNVESLIYHYTYCYISPTAFWHEDLNWKEETFNTYAERKKLSLELLRNVFASSKKIKALQTENLNYDIN